MLLKSMKQHDFPHISYNPFTIHHQRTEDSVYLHSQNSSGSMLTFPFALDNHAQSSFSSTYSLPFLSTHSSMLASKSEPNDNGASKDNFIVEELTPEEYEYYMSVPSIYPYEYEEAKSECGSTKAETPSCKTLSNTDTEISRTSCTLATGSPFDILETRKITVPNDLESREWKRRGRKRSLPMTISLDATSNVSRLANFDRNGAVRCVRPRLSERYESNGSNSETHKDTHNALITSNTEQNGSRALLHVPAL